MSASLDVMRLQLNAAVRGARPGMTAADELCGACVDLFDVDGAAVSVVYQGESRGTFGSSSAASRRLDEFQFTFGEGPCLDSVANREAVLVPDLDSPDERRWPVLAGALLESGIRGVFALPIMVTSVCVGALDLFRAGPGPLHDDQLAGAWLAARLASGPLFDLIAESSGSSALDDLGEGDRTASGYDGDLDRVEVYQATGILIAQLEVDAAEALVRLRAHAVATGQTASQVAWAVVEGRLVLDRDNGEAPERGGTR